MALNTDELNIYFNAGIATIAVSTPVASEPELLSQLFSVADTRGMDLMTWSADPLLQPDKSPSVILQKLIRKRNTLSYEAGHTYEVKGHPIAALLQHIRNHSASRDSKPTLFVVKDLYPFIGGDNPNPALIRALVETCHALKSSRNRLVILHESTQKTPTCFQDLIADMSNASPTEEQAAAILESRIQSLKASAKVHGVDFQVTLSDSEKKRMIRSLLGMTSEGMIDALQRIATKYSRFDARAIDEVAAIKKAQFASRGVEYAPPPDVLVQGMPRLMSWADTSSALLEPAAQDEWNLPFPRGTLIVGENGTGKTLAIKVLAQRWGLPIVILDISKMMQKELGSSERNLRETIAAAEAMAPSILFIDEMEKMFSGGSDDAGGTSTRMFGYFLQWFQEHKSPVFVAATANEPWRFKPEMLRRFDITWYVDLPDLNTRTEIFRVQMAHYKLLVASSDQDRLLERLASETQNFTGDEIRKVVYQCASNAYAQRRAGQVTLQDYLAQINRKPAQFSTTTPRLQQLREWASGGMAEWVADRPATAIEYQEAQRDRNLVWAQEN